jgi:hypothetical protein
MQRGEASKIDFAKAVVGIAKMTAVEVDDFMVELFCEAIEPHGWTKGIAGLKQIALTSRKFPTIAELLKIVAPHQFEIDTRDDAAVIAGQIERALVRFGSRNSSKGFPEAREMIGEAGWSVVGPRWQHICDTATTDDMPTLKAQWRGEVKGALERAKARLPLAVGLPHGLVAEDVCPDLALDKRTLPPVMAQALAVANGGTAAPW